MMTSSSPFEALCPTRDVSALSACFEPVDDGSTEPLSVLGAAVELEDGNCFWLTRLPAINTTYHRAAEVLEIGASSIFELDGAGEAVNKETKRPNFWDVLSNEFFAHCYCGDLSSARELMRVIESQCVVNAAQTQVVVAECDDLPIQVYLFEFEPEGLGIVHLAHGVEWDHDFQALEICGGRQLRLFLQNCPTFLIPTTTLPHMTSIARTRLLSKPVKSWRWRLGCTA